MFTYLSDKYFQDLDAFNKMMVPHKLSFFKDVQGLSFFNFLDILSYNLDITTPNYRWGKRYFSQDYKDFKWITSNDKKISINYWNSSEHCYEQREVKAIFTEDMLKSHFLSCFSNNRKIKFYYKLSNFEKNELRNHNLSLSNMYMVDGKTFGSTQKIGSDILLIDIDNYKDRSALETLTLFLDFTNLKVKDLLYIEQNAFTGGIHTALKLPHKITNTEFYSEFMKELNNNDIRIECNFINNILRFPLSFEYVAIKKDENILNYDEFIPSDLWEETFDSYLNNLNFDVCNSEYINNFIKKFHISEENFNKYENYWNIKRNIILRDNKTINNKFKNLNFYEIENGKRYETMSKLVPFCKIQGFSLDETVEIIRTQNKSSKDLNSWSYDKLKNNIKKFYDKCPDKITSFSRFNGYISNINNLPEITLKFLDSDKFKSYITKKFIQYYIEERNKHNANIKNLSDEKIEILNKQIPYIAKEIIGKMFYDLNHQKSFVKGINEKIGFQLPDSHLKAIQEQSIIDLSLTSPLAKTSLQYLKKAILRALSLKEISYRNRTRNWMLGSCKSFNIKNSNELFNLLNHYYNSINKKTFNEENILLILYILLIENIDFQRYCDDEHILRYVT